MGCRLDEKFFYKLTSAKERYFTALIGERGLGPRVFDPETEELWPIEPPENWDENVVMKTAKLKAHKDLELMYILRDTMPIQPDNFYAMAERSFQLLDRLVSEFGLVHRDIHPGNIMINDSYEPCFIDFELAERLESLTSSSKAAAIARDYTRLYYTLDRFKVVPADELLAIKESHLGGITS